jgi:AraC-like DNA-binding protein
VTERGVAPWVKADSGTILQRLCAQGCNDIFLDNGKYFLNSNVVVCFDPSRPTFAPYGFTCEVWKLVPMKRPDRHNEIELNLLQRGTLHYLLGGQRVTIEAGRLAAFWAAIPHQIVGSTHQTKYFVATIPLTWFLQFQFPAHFVHSILHGQLLLSEDHSIRAQSDLALFAQWVKDFQDTGEARRRAVLLEMEARLLRFALAVPKRKPIQSKFEPSHPLVETSSLKCVEQMACFIAQNYTRKITADDISHGVNLHPNYAMTLFKRTFGMSLIDCVTQHRISHAQRLLATSKDKIIEVALTSGFNSVSRFNEAFKKLCLCSPRQYRESHRLS